MAIQKELHELFKVAEVELVYRKNKNAVQPIVNSAPAAQRGVLQSQRQCRVGVIAGDEGETIRMVASCIANRRKSFVRPARNQHVGAFSEQRGRGCEP